MRKFNIIMIIILVVSSITINVYAETIEDNPIVIPSNIPELPIDDVNFNGSFWAMTYKETTQTWSLVCPVYTEGVEYRVYYSSSNYVCDSDFVDIEITEDVDFYNWIASLNGEFEYQGVFVGSEVFKYTDEYVKKLVDVRNPSNNCVYYYGSKFSTGTGVLYYQSKTVLELLNECTDLSSFNNVWMNKKTELGVNNTFLDNYVRYTIGRQSRINEALFNAKPYSSVSEFSTKFTELCKPLYKLITMPEDTTEIFIKNTLSVGSIPIQIDWYKADYRSTWTYADGTKIVMQNEDMTDHDELWEYDAGESELIELLNPIEGKIAIRYEQDIGLFVVFSNYEDGGSSEPPVVGPLQPIEEIHMPQGPNRANYDEGVWGSINYSLDCILYWVGYPFIIMNYLSQRFIIYMQTLTNNIGAMGNVMNSIVSWMPPEMITILILGVITGVIMKIFGR